MAFPLSIQVESWILEYSIKHNMESILKRFDTKRKLMTARTVEMALPSQDFGPWECLESSHLLLWFLCSTGKRLENPRQFEDVELLQYFLEVLHKLYFSCRTISLSTFWSLYTKIKIMVLLQCLRQKTATAKLLNKFFPLWSHTYEDKLRTEFEITDDSEIELIRRDHVSCRLFIFNLMLSEGNLVTRYKEFLVNEWGDYIDHFKQLLTDYLDSVLPRLPETKIDKFLRNDIEDDLADLTNPAVCTLLNALQECTAKRSSIESALQKTLLNLHNLPDDHSESPSQKPFSERCSQSSSPNSVKANSIESPTHLTDPVQDYVHGSASNGSRMSKDDAESSVSFPTHKNDVVEISTAEEEEPVPSTSSGITHGNHKKRKMPKPLQRRKKNQPVLAFRSSRRAVSSSDDDSS